MEQEVVTVGLDLAKNVFQVHAIAADGAVLIRRKLRRTEVIRFFAELSPCLVGMEACASAHHWARELMAIGHGLTPRANSSGGKERLGGITKQGDGYLRRLLVVGSTAVMRMTRKHPARQPWMAGLLERKPTKIATVALANKTARIAWAVMTRKEVYAAAA
jgi:transposase